MRFWKRKKDDMMIAFDQWKIHIGKEKVDSRFKSLKGIIANAERGTRAVLYFVFQNSTIRISIKIGCQGCTPLFLRRYSQSLPPTMQIRKAK